jgi:hypothetical protein
MAVHKAIRSNHLAQPKRLRPNSAQILRPKDGLRISPAAPSRSRHGFTPAKRLNFTPATRKARALTAVVLTGITLITNAKPNSWKLSTTSTADTASPSPRSNAWKPKTVSYGP